VTELANVDERDVATLLIISPSIFDDDFIQFSAVFDQLIEPSVQATGSEVLVGRALFHPKYQASLIGHDKVIAGHALPAKLVEDFMKQYAPSGNERSDNCGGDVDVTEGIPDIQTIALANDVRWNRLSFVYYPIIISLTRQLVVNSQTLFC
jgi:hypothetical protein